MIEGTRPAECSYCWEVEDASEQAISDRIIKSSDPWAYPELDRVKNLPWNHDIIPNYLEVMLDDRCNFSCMYCSANVSVSIAKEMESFGQYNVMNAEHRMPLYKKLAGNNEYVQAFYRWLPEILPELKVLRITGGEPLLSTRL